MRNASWYVHPFFNRQHSMHLNHMIKISLSITNRLVVFNGTFIVLLGYTFFSIGRSVLTILLALARILQTRLCQQTNGVDELSSEISVGASCFRLNLRETQPFSDLFAIMDRVFELSAKSSSIVKVEDLGVIFFGYITSTTVILLIGYACTLFHRQFPRLSRVNFCQFAPFL